MLLELESDFGASDFGPSRYDDTTMALFMWHSMRWRASLYMALDEVAGLSVLVLPLGLPLWVRSIEVGSKSRSGIGLGRARSSVGVPGTVESGKAGVAVAILACEAPRCLREPGRPVGAGQMYQSPHKHQFSNCISSNPMGFRLTY